MRSEMPITTRISCSMRRMRDAAFVAQPADERRGLGGLVGVHARRRLVEQQQARPRGQRAGDLQSALVAVGQAGGLDVALAAESHEDQQVLGFQHGGLLLGLLAPRADDGAHPARDEVLVGAHEDVLERRHAPEEADVLVRPREAEVRDPIGTQLVDGEAVEGDAALVDLVEAGDAVEEGRLAGAVGPDDADDGALVDGEVQGIDGQQAAEALGGCG